MVKKHNRKSNQWFQAILIIISALLLILRVLGIIPENVLGQINFRILSIISIAIITKSVTAVDTTIFSALLTHFFFLGILIINFHEFQFIQINAIYPNIIPAKDIHFIIFTIGLFNVFLDSGLLMLNSKLKTGFLNKISYIFLLLLFK